MEILLQDPTCGPWWSWDSYPGLGSCRGRAFGDRAWMPLGVVRSPGSGKPLQTVRATLFPKPQASTSEHTHPYKPPGSLRDCSRPGPAAHLCDVCCGSATWPWDAGCPRPSHWQISSAASKPLAPPGCPGEQEQPGQASKHCCLHQGPHNAGLHQCDSCLEPELMLSRGQEASDLQHRCPRRALSPQVAKQRGDHAVPVAW